MDILTLTRDSKHFPQSFKSELVKPPITKVWYRGQVRQELFTKCAAVVGSRRMSRYGRQATEEVVSRLVEAGYTIVSGLMYGVDQLAHKVCLERGGTAIGVLGYGIANNNEEGATKLINEIVHNGGLVMSEYEGDSVSQMWMFPQRNRIVAAISHIVVVVEAGLKSGSLITARLANKMGKTVYAVPGPLFSPTSEGTNWLIACNKAHILTLDALGTLTGIQHIGCVKEKVKHLNAGEREIYMRLSLDGPQTANQIARSLSLSAKEVVAHLVQMNMKDVVREDKGVWMTL